ncbi:MAG TPA: hypothetical protein VM122_06715 [Usitatibacter sp.]|nr:hypothetical protein [Usitatibacter sp.]
MPTPLAALLVAATLALPVRAETSAVSASSFLSTHRVEVAAAPRAVFEAIGRIGEWWSSEHVYSGNAANLSLELRAGACLCERWDANSVEHGRVIYAQRDRTLRIETALGPLQEMAVTGILQFAVAPADGGATTLTVTYRVRGPDAGLDKVAAVVDRVLGEQARRLGAYAARQ